VYCGGVQALEPSLLAFGYMLERMVHNTGHIYLVLLCLVLELVPLTEPVESRL